MDEAHAAFHLTRSTRSDRDAYLIWDRRDFLTTRKELARNRKRGG
jgi:hypothetical protein